jgi:hypothetical protein
MRKAEANILKELVNHFISSLYNNKLQQSIHDLDDWYKYNAMWKAYDLVNQKAMILKHREEDTIKSSNKAKAKLLNKMLKSKFNNPIELQTFLA